MDCIGWDRDQFSFFSSKGFMSSEDYPYNTTGPDVDPPVPFNPCRYAPSRVIAGTADGTFTNLQEPRHRRPNSRHFCFVMVPFKLESMPTFLPCARKDAKRIQVASSLQRCATIHPSRVKALIIV